METVEIQVVLTEAAVAEILDAITHTSARLLARDPDAIYATLQQRRAAVGGAGARAGKPARLSTFATVSVGLAPRASQPSSMARRKCERSRHAHRRTF